MIDLNNRKIQTLISVAKDLGINSFTVQDKEMVITIHLHSGNFIDDEVPDYIKKSVLKIGK
jgi:hypothetical protein